MTKYKNLIKLDSDLLMPYGFRAYTGVVFTDAQVDHYNALYDTIAAHVLVGQDPIELKNGAHNYFASIALTTEK